MSLRKKTTVVLVAALTAFAMVACGSKPGSDAPEQPSVLELLATDLRGSLQKTMEATDKSDSVTVKMQGTAGAEKVSAQGVIDLGDPVKAEMTTAGPDGGAPTIVRMIGTVIYVEVPAEERAGMDGKRWMKLDLSAAGEQAGMDFTKQFEDIDPIKQVKTLLATEGVTVVGEETVNGAQTVHYTVTSPVATYLGHLDAELRSGVEKQYAKLGVKEVKVDLWVDGDYRPRRAAMDMGKMGDMTVDYTDYGKPVNIETPPAAETFDFAEMLQGLKGLSGGN